MSQITVDLVVVIDTSYPFKNEAQDLNAAAQAGIETAASSCPSDLRVVWLGIEGTWKNTNFDQTVRKYLMENCAVAESDIRGRKRGTLKSAGAQEDGARAIQDVATHFHWRSGAQRAIFYLGNEALDSGGNKTEQKDIEAANLAIQTAKANQVVVHTYFGKSKSRHKQTLETEYARLASETGGQAFTVQNAQEGFKTIVEQVICNSQVNSDVQPESTQVQISNQDTQEVFETVVEQVIDNNQVNSDVKPESTQVQISNQDTQEVFETVVEQVIDNNQVNSDVEPESTQVQISNQDTQEVFETVVEQVIDNNQVNSDVELKLIQRKKSNILRKKSKYCNIYSKAYPLKGGMWPWHIYMCC